MTQKDFAQITDISLREVTEFVEGRGRISGEMGIPMLRAFELSENYWIRMQANYDHEIGKER